MPQAHPVHHQEFFSSLRSFPLSSIGILIVSIVAFGTTSIAKAGDGFFVNCERKDNYPLQARIYHQRGGMEIHWASGMVNRLSIVNFDNSIYKDQHGSAWSEQSTGLNKFMLKRNDFTYNCSILDRFWPLRGYGRSLTCALFAIISLVEAGANRWMLALFCATSDLLQTFCPYRCSS